MWGFTWSLALLLCACGSVKPDADAPMSNDAAPGQPGDLVWVRSMSAAFGQGIADGAGGLIYTGSITAPADLGGGLMTPLGAADLVVGDLMASDASYVYQVRHNDASGGQVYGFLQQTDAQGNPLVYGVSYGDVDLGKGHDPAAVMEDLFEANGWGDTWRDGIYDYVHYHSRIHEVLGIARGKGRVRFGGSKGRIFTLKAGDVAILPAGTGHQRLSADEDFLVVGAYPPVGTYDECTEIKDRPRALKAIPKVPGPREDPVYGGKGPLSKLWKKP